MAKKKAIPPRPRPDNRDLQMMKSPDDWPCWPFLPLKRSDPKGGWPECATLTGQDGVFTLIRAPMPFTEEQVAAFKKAPTERYTSAEAIVADGWMVD